MRPGALAAVCAILALLGPVGARQRRSSAPQLLQVLTPAGRATVPAHPDVNVVVRFPGSGANTLADPSSFRARLGGRDITSQFQPLMEGGAQVGVRASIPRDRLKMGHRRMNRLRVLARTRQSDAKKRNNRQVVSVRFRAVEATNQPPVATIVPDTEIIFPGVALGFDASHSFDPESDALTYQWDFGDGGTSADIAPTHVYASADDPRTVTLTVSDGQASTAATLTMRACPQPESVAPAIIQLSADAPLEFGGVPPGNSAVRTFTVQNLATDPTSRLAACIGFDGGGFSVTPDHVDLGAGETATVTVTFSPTAEGHDSGRVALVSGASNAPLVALLTHGYGGNAPGAGPTLASTPLFYSVSTSTATVVQGFMPNGATIGPLDLGIGACGSDSGFGSGDACVVDSDCAINGGTCQHGQGNNYFDVTEMCSGNPDGVYLLSEDTFYDQTDADPALSGTLLALALDPNGNVTGRTILGRLTEDTTHVACDTFSANDGGRVYLAQDDGVPAMGDCFRDTKESLVGLRKSNGNSVTLMSRIDQAEGLSECDDIDNTVHIEVSGDGSQAFASFDSGGLWRLRPTPLQFLDSSFIEDIFRLHPDGSIMFATIKNAPTTSVVSVFKVTPSQVATSPLPENGLTPCATFQLPNRKDSRVSSFFDFVVAPAATGSRDGIAYVNVGAARSPTTSDTLAVRGTVAFSSPADSSACTPIGLINLERTETLTD